MQMAAAQAWETHYRTNRPAAAAPAASPTTSHLTGRRHYVTRVRPGRGDPCHARCARRAVRLCREDSAKVLLPEDQHSVGDFGAHGQHEPFGEAVRPRASRRDLDDLNTCVGQHLVERCRELSGPIMDEESEPGDVFAEVHEEVAGLLSGPGSVGVVASPRRRPSGNAPIVQQAGRSGSGFAFRCASAAANCFR